MGFSAEQEQMDFYTGRAIQHYSLSEEVIGRQGPQEYVDSEHRGRGKKNNKQPPEKLPKEKHNKSQFFITKMRSEDKEKSKFWEYKDVLVILNAVESTTEIQRSP